MKNKNSWLVIIIGTLPFSACTSESHPKKSFIPYETFYCSSPQLGNDPQNRTEELIENITLPRLWQNPNTGLNWGPFIIDDQPHSRTAHQTSSHDSHESMGFSFSEARTYCEEHQARLPRVTEWRELLHAIGAQADAALETSPSHFNPPPSLTALFTPEFPLLQYAWLEDPFSEPTPDMHFYYHVINRQTGAIEYAEDHYRLAFVCVW